MNTCFRCLLLLMGGTWLLLAGCGPGEPPSPEASTWQPVELPGLANLEAPVRTQLEEVHARTRATPGRHAADTTLGGAFGRLGQLLVAYDFFDAAVPALRNAEALQPTRARWSHYLGYAYLQANKPEAGAGRFERVLAMHPDDVPARVHLAGAYRDLGREPEARALLLDAVRLDPRCAAAYYLLGQMAGTDEADQAITYYETALRLQPDASIARYPLGNAYRDRGDLEKSRQHLARRGDRQFRLQDPWLGRLEALKTGTGSKLNRGSQLVAQGRTPEALSLFEEAVAEDPDNAEAHMHLGTAYASLGRPDEAIETLEQALHLDPSKQEAHFYLGVLYGGLGDDARALNHFREAIALNPADANAHYALSQVLWRRQACREALPHFATYLEANPEHVQTRTRQVVCLVQTGDPAAARAALEAGLTVAPEHPGLQDALVRVLAASDDPDVRDGPRAVALAERLVQALPRPETLESLAMAYAEAGRFNDAVARQRQAIEAARQYQMTSLVATMTDNLQRYEQDRPCRTPWSDVIFAQ